MRLQVPREKGEKQIAKNGNRTTPLIIRTRGKGGGEKKIKGNSKKQVLRREKKKR